MKSIKLITVLRAVAIGWMITSFAKRALSNKLSGAAQYIEEPFF